MTHDRISAIGRVAILTSASEENSDPYVEVTTTDARALLDENRELRARLDGIERAFTPEHLRRLLAEHDRLAVEAHSLPSAEQRAAHMRAARDMLRKTDDRAATDVLIAERAAKDPA